MQRLFELRDEVHTFLMNKNNALADLLVDQYWLAKMAYLVDIFGMFNDLNLGLQGRDTDVFKHADKIKSFLMKKKLWRTRVGQGRIDMFSCLSGVMRENESVPFFPAIQAAVSSHLDLLTAKLEQYFPAANGAEVEWILNPFTADISTHSLSVEQESQLIELSCDRGLKTKFESSKLSDFWLYAATEYPQLSDAAIIIVVLLPFTTTYLCETALFSMTAMKTKYRNKLNVSDDLRLCLSAIAPRIDSLVDRMQAHPSH